MLGAWWRRLVMFLQRDRVRRELEDEMQLHRELRARAMEADGMTPTDAAAAAHRRFGHASTLSERSQESWGFRRSDELRWNVRYALRRLSARPWYAAAIVLVLGLGVGATTAMFSAVDAVILRALPFREPSQLVTLPWVELPFAPGPGRPADVRAALDLTQVAALPQLFSSVAAYAVGRLNLRDAERPVLVRAGVVTDGFFRTLGTAPATGRTFVTEESVPAARAVVVLSDGLWRRQYGRRAILGETIRLDDQPYVVLGVMPPGFSFPEECDLWIPAAVPNTPESFTAFGSYPDWQAIARLTRNLGVEAANRRLLDRWATTIDAPGLPIETPERRAEQIAEIRATGAVLPLQASLAGRRGRALLVLLGATGLLLLIACANVTNLLVADAATRTREVALRTALGASWGRVFRQLLTESVILALGGLVAGLVVAPVVLHFLRALMPVELAGVAVPRIDWRVLAFASSLAFVTGIAFGVWPAGTAGRVDPAEALKSSGGLQATRRRGARQTRVLIAVELALTVVLLVGSGLLLRSFSQLMRVDRGMETAQVAALELSFASTTPDHVRLARIDAMLERLRHSPGIESAAAINDLPLGGSLGAFQPLAPAAGAPARGTIPSAARYLHVSSGYFTTLGISLIEGRDFTERDDSRSPPTVIINETLAQRWFPTVDPVGRQLTVGTAPGVTQAHTVIGVVGDVREESLDGDPPPQIYHPIRRLTPRAFALVARGRAKPELLLASLRNAVRGVDPSQAVGPARMMEQVVRDSVAAQRTNALLITLFAGLAVLLAALGVYSVVAHGMAQRQREFGIRTALGASASDLLAMVSREIVVVVAIGISVGLVGAWAGARLVQAMLYGVTVHDPATFTIGPMALGVIAMSAAVLPLCRVFRIDPRDVIRAE